MKVRITKNAKPGDQENFALVTGAENVSYGITPDDCAVKHTMGAVPREQANVEVEGGETAIGDLNLDGYVELMTFTGPKHKQGGVPVNLPEGSFVFSDSDKLKIEDKKLLRDNFNYKGSTATPAAVSKKFKLNDFVNVLRKDEGDAISMNTAQIMVDTNMEKLAELALVQESMKGFPTGIPAIAELLAGPEMAQAELGGLITMQDGGGTSARAASAGETSYASKLFSFIKDSYTAAEQKSLAERETMHKNYLKGEEEKKKAKEQSSKSSGNRRVDEAILNYRKTPSVGNAKALMKFIEEAYPETHDNSPFLSLIPGYQDSFLESDFVKTAYQDAMLHSDANGSKGDDYISPTQGQVMDTAKSFYNQAQATLDSGNLLPGEEQKLRKEISKIQSAVTSGNYDTAVDRWFFSREQAAQSAPKQTVAAADFSTPLPSPVSQNDDPAIPASFSATPETVIQPEIVPDPVKKAEPAGKAATTTKQAAKQRYEVLAEFEKGGDVMSEGGEPKHNLQVVRDTETGAYVLRNKKTGADIFSTYQSETATPGGSASGFAGIDGNDFVKYMKDWVNALGISGDEISSAKDFQKRIYEHQLKNNPAAVQKVWSEIGLNNAALKDKALTAKLMASGALDPTKGNLINFEKLSEADRAQVMGDLGAHYADGMIGVRSLNFTAPRPKETIIEAPERGVPLTTPEIHVPNTLKNSQVPEKAVTQEETTDPVSQSARKQGGWYLPDVVNMASVMTDPINRYEPLLAQVDLETVDPSFRDPSRMIAANQEQQAKFNDAVQNSMDSTVAASTMLASSGQAFEQIANGLSEVEMQNASIANQTAAQNAQIRNQETIANTEALQRYVGEMATLNQNIDDSKRLKKARVNAAWNNGMNNWYRKKAMEQVLFPQTYQDPITGNWEFSGEGRDINGADTYQGAGTQTAADLQNVRMLELQRNLEMVKSLESKGYTKEQIDAASKMSSGTRNSTQLNDRMAMAQMMMGTMPDLPF